MIELLRSDTGALIGAGKLAGEMFLLTTTSRDTAAAAKGIVENRLYKTYQSSDYYMVMTSAEMMDAMNTMMNTMMIVLVAIAAISLLVGGIGIMNIMLVSVTERTREIGIRKSLGAKQKNIRGQFVIEAGTTSAVGGVLGIAFGLLLARAATIAVGAIMSSSMNGVTFSAVPTLSDIAVSFGVSVGIGILFGYLPANKAAKLLEGYQPAYKNEISTAKEKWIEELNRLDHITFSDKKSWKPEINDANADSAKRFAQDVNAQLTQTAALGALNAMMSEGDVAIGAAGSLPGDMQRMWRPTGIDTYNMEYGYSTMGYEVAGSVV